MNYRHAYHAGNHTEVFKHAALVLLLEHFRLKPKPFMVLDTHAGIGVYNLQSAEAEKTKEAEEGISRVISSKRPELRSYLACVSDFVQRGEYPGSPAIVAKLLRPADRLIACELHPADACSLRRNMASTPCVAVHHRNGYEAVGAFVPPVERRGFVFMDPPFESRDEAVRLGHTLVRGARKWPTGCFVGWYPIKDNLIGDTISNTLIATGLPNCLRAEFLRHPMDGTRLAGSGLVLVNPPWRTDEALRELNVGLKHAFGYAGRESAVEWLTPAI